MAVLDNDTQISVLVDKLDHPEGIAWGLDGYAYAGGEAGQLYRIDIDAKTWTQIADTGGFILGLALDADHNIYACDVGNSTVMKITQTGVVSVYSTGTPDAPFKCPNYPAFDTEGNLYVCASGGFHEDDGLIYKIKPGGETAPTNIAFCGPNRDVLLGANIGRWHITRYETGAAGHRLNYPQID